MEVLIPLVKIILMISPLVTIGTYGLISVEKEHEKGQKELFH